MYIVMSGKNTMSFNLKNLMSNDVGPSNWIWMWISGFIFPCAHNISTWVLHHFVYNHIWRCDLCASCAQLLLLFSFHIQPKILCITLEFYIKFTSQSLCNIEFLCSYRFCKYDRFNILILPMKYTNFTKLQVLVHVHVALIPLFLTLLPGHHSNKNLLKCCLCWDRISPRWTSLCQSLIVPLYHASRCKNDIKRSTSSHYPTITHFCFFLFLTGLVF